MEVEDDPRPEQLCRKRCEHEKVRHVVHVDDIESVSEMEARNEPHGGEEKP